MATILGIDVGGTSTDAVLLNAAGVQAKAKVATTADVYSGIEDAISGITAHQGAGTCLQWPCEGCHVWMSTPKSCHRWTRRC